MNAYKSVLFFFLVIALLAVVAYVFPAEGLSVGSITIKFPSLEKVLMGNKYAESLSESVDFESDIDVESLSIDTVQNKQILTQIEDEMSQLDSATLAQIIDIKDTIEYCKNNSTDIGKILFLPNDSIGYFDDVFAKMEDARLHRNQVRVLHYGDSQIELDRMSGELRSYFQSIFGGKGVGLVPLMQSIPNMSITQTVDGNFETVMAYGIGKRDSTGNYGIMAKSFRINDTVVFTAKSPRYDENRNLRSFSNVKLLFNDVNGNFTVDFKDDNSERQFKCHSDGVGLGLFEWQSDSVMTSVTITLCGEADIYGIMFDGDYGVSVDNIPLRASSGIVFTMVDDELLRQSYVKTNVALIIMQFGGNSVPALSGKKSIEAFASDVKRQIKYLKRVYPEATLMYIGPSDMATRKDGVMTSYPLLNMIVKELRAAVLSEGVAYWDMHAMMGGTNSMLKWVENGLAGQDYIHFTKKGSQKAGDALVNSFFSMYDIYLLKQQFDTQKFDSLWRVSYR